MFVYVCHEFCRYLRRTGEWDCSVHSDFTIVYWHGPSCSVCDLGLDRSTSKLCPRRGGAAEARTGGNERHRFGSIPAYRDPRSACKRRARYCTFRCGCRWPNHFGRSVINRARHDITETLRSVSGRAELQRDVRHHRRWFICSRSGNGPSGVHSGFDVLRNGDDTCSIPSFEYVHSDDNE